MTSMEFSNHFLGTSDRRASINPPDPGSEEEMEPVPLDKPAPNSYRVPNKRPVSVALNSSGKESLLGDDRESFYT